jgi:hypothetical protein
VPTAPPGNRTRMPQRPRRWRAAGGRLRPLLWPASPNRSDRALSFRVPVSSGPLTAAGPPGRSRRPALSNKSGISALLQGTRGDWDAGRAAGTPSHTPILQRFTRPGPRRIGGRRRSGGHRSAHRALPCGLVPASQLHEHGDLPGRWDAHAHQPRSRRTDFKDRGVRHVPELLSPGTEPASEDFRVPTEPDGSSMYWTRTVVGPAGIEPATDGL